MRKIRKYSFSQDDHEILSRDPALICDQRIKMELEILIFCTGERRCRPRGRGVVKYWNRRFHVEAMLSPGNAN